MKGKDDVAHGGSEQQSLGYILSYIVYNNSIAAITARNILPLGQWLWLSW